MARGKPTVVSVVGARPQFIKLAPLARYLSGRCRHVIIHSGQHYDYEMSQAFFDQLRIPRPDINLNVGSGLHGLQTGRVLERCEKRLVSIRPDMVLVYGDTNTTLAGALAAAKLSLPVGHIEAGLRSFRRDMPEEINRVMADHVSELLFYPTPTARKNLRNEGITRGVIRSGDLMFEIMDNCRSIIARNKTILRNHKVDEGDFILVTLHRAENVDDPQRLEQFVNVMENLQGIKLFLAHPRTLKNLRRFKFLARLKKAPGMIVGNPQPYIETLTLISKARAIMTDSGGIQKEARFLGRPCLTLRKETEWIETVAAGANFLVDMSLTKIRRAIGKAQGRGPKLEYRIKGRKPSLIIGQSIFEYLRKQK
jgi:UDP-N-acetylglucosamine 2-epimerase